MKLKQLIISLVLSLTMIFGFGLANSSAKGCTGNSCKPLPTQSHGCDKSKHNPHCNPKPTAKPTHIINTPKPTRIINTPKPTSVINTPKPTKANTAVPTKINTSVPTKANTSVPTRVINTPQYTPDPKSTNTPFSTSTITIPTSTGTSISISPTVAISPTPTVVNTLLTASSVSCPPSNNNPWLPWIFLVLGSIGTAFGIRNRNNVKKLKG